MNSRDIRTEQFAVRASAYRHTHTHTPQVWSHGMSRRQFGRLAANTVAIGAALGTGLWKPGLAYASRSGEAVPIPGGSPFLGGSFHVFGPAAFDPIDAEPATITDFNGFDGLAYISGTVTQTNTATGEVRTLPFVESDMRFMKGVFIGTDGRTHQGAFALV
jgi:hypothetical protein